MEPHPSVWARTTTRRASLQLSAPPAFFCSGGLPSKRRLIIRAASLDTSDEHKLVGYRTATLRDAPRPVPGLISVSEPVFEYNNETVNSLAAAAAAHLSNKSSGYPIGSSTNTGPGAALASSSSRQPYELRPCAKHKHEHSHRHVNAQIHTNPAF